MRARGVRRGARARGLAANRHPFPPFLRRLHTHPPPHHPLTRTLVSVATVVANACPPTFRVTMDAGDHGSPSGGAQPVMGAGGEREGDAREGKTARGRASARLCGHVGWAPAGVGGLWGGRARGGIPAQNEDSGVSSSFASSFFGFPTSSSFARRRASTLPFPPVNRTLSLTPSSSPNGNASGGGRPPLRPAPLAVPPGRRVPVPAAGRLDRVAAVQVREERVDSVQEAGRMWRRGRGSGRDQAAMHSRPPTARTDPPLFSLVTASSPFSSKSASLPWSRAPCAPRTRATCC